MGDLVDALEGSGTHHRDPQAAVGGEALLRCEVVDVGVGDVDRQAACARRGVDGDQRVVGARGTDDGHSNTGRRLVVGPPDEVDAAEVVDGQSRRIRCGSRIGGDHRGGVEERRLLGDRRELGAELAVGQVQRTLLDQAERRRIPERSGAAVGQHHLVALGQREQVGETRADRADDVLHRRLAVGGANHRRSDVDQRLQLLGAHLRRSAAEPAVGGQQLCGDGDGFDGDVAHARNSRDVVPTTAFRPSPRAYNPGLTTSPHPSTSSGRRGAGPV